MTDLTRVYAYKTLDDASDSAGFWKERGYHVAVCGPTDAIRLARDEGSPAVWESGEEADWYLVVASKAPLEIVAAKVASNNP